MNHWIDTLLDVLGIRPTPRPVPVTLPNPPRRR